MCTGLESFLINISVNNSAFLWWNRWYRNLLSYTVGLFDVKFPKLAIKKSSMISSKSHVLYEWLLNKIVIIKNAFYECVMDVNRNSSALLSWIHCGIGQYWCLNQFRRSLKIKVNLSQQKKKKRRERFCKHNVLMLGQMKLLCLSAILVVLLQLTKLFCSFVFKFMPPICMMKLLVPLILMFLLHILIA